MIGDDRATREQSLIMVKVIFYSKKSSLQERHHLLRHSHEKHLRGCFLILKSLNSDNLRRKLQESIIALGSLKEL